MYSRYCVYLLLHTLALPTRTDQDVEIIKIDSGKRCNSKYSIASAGCNFAACQAMCEYSPGSVLLFIGLDIIIHRHFFK